MTRRFFRRSVPAAALIGLGALLAVPGSLLSRSQPTNSREDARQFVQYGDPVIAITGVQVVDGTGTAPRSGQTVVIADRRIQSVGADGEVEIPEGRAPD